MKSVFGFRVRLRNPDLDFENLNPGFPIERTLTECITNLACKAGVFCSSSNDTIIGTNALRPSWTLNLTESWGELKHYSRGEDDDFKIKEGKGKERKNIFPFFYPPLPP